jgi:hypothetical protein
VAGMIKAKIDNGHEEKPKKPKVPGKEMTQNTCNAVTWNNLMMEFSLLVF